VVIPPRSNGNTPREYDVHQYKHRNFIERLFCRIKYFRGIATRHDKFAQRSAFFVALVAALRSPGSGPQPRRNKKAHRLSLTTRM